VGKDAARGLADAYRTGSSCVAQHFNRMFHVEHYLDCSTWNIGLPVLLG